MYLLLLVAAIVHARAQCSPGWKNNGGECAECPDGTVNTGTGGPLVCHECYAELTSSLLLYCSYKNVTGTIPPELAELETLRFLLLNGNQLTGTIPSQLAELEALVYLYMDGNQLTGCVPYMDLCKDAIDEFPCTIKGQHDTIRDLGNPEITGLCPTAAPTAPTMAPTALEEWQCACDRRNADGTFPCGRDGDACVLAHECSSGVCEDGTCAEPSCSDGVHNGDETGVDCGGACVSWEKHTGKQCHGRFKQATLTEYGTIADAQAACLENPDCHGVFDSYGCDGNGPFFQCHEASTWGSSSTSCIYAPVGMCADKNKCVANSDCESRRCEHDICISCDDGKKNGDETDVDCGGFHCPPWPEHASTACVYINWRTFSSLVDAQLACTDDKECYGVMHEVDTNGFEDYRMCGWKQDWRTSPLLTETVYEAPVAGTCNDGDTCAEGRRDCASGVCDATTKTCVSCSDNTQNGNETDVDCGGQGCAASWQVYRKHCADNKAVPTAYGSLVDAQVACTANPECHGVYDSTCDFSDSFYLCKEESTWQHSSSSCVYALPVGMCADGKKCTEGSDCASGQCDAATDTCASCSDNIRNGDETDVDCGGQGCAAWTTVHKKGCKGNEYYISLAGAQVACTADPECHGVAEVDTGFNKQFYLCKEESTWHYSLDGRVHVLPVSGMCADGKKCADGRDCESRRCDAGKCTS